jgi:histidinol-phosphate aminotransferase
MTISYTALANPSVQALTPYQPGTPISDVQRKYGIQDVIKLASNENPLGPSPKALAAIQQCLLDMARYPDGSGHELKQALADYWQINPNRLTLGNGSDALFVLLEQAFVKPGQQTIVSQYGFAVFSIAAHIAQSDVITIPAKNWGHDLDATLKAVTPDTRIIFIANPNNPTAAWNNEAQIKQFLDKLPAHILVVLDEAYAEFMDGVAGYPNGIKLQERYPNLVVTRTFSKIYGLAGLRVGYAVSHPEVADMMNRVRLAFNVSACAMKAAIAALQDQEHVTKTLAITRQGMQYLQEELQGLGLQYLPAAGNFLTIDVKQDGVGIYQKMLQQGVIVRPLVNYGLPQFLRVSIGTMAENERFIRTLRNVL